MIPRRVPSLQRPATAVALACAVLFAPITSSAEDAEVIAIEEASGRELTALLIGNTLVVRAPDQTDGTHGYLHLQEDGTALFREMLRGGKRGRIRWSVDESQRLCITETLEPGARRGCGLFRITGNDLYIHGDNGKVEHMKARLLRGGPPE